MKKKEILYDENGNIVEVPSTFERLKKPLGIAAAVAGVLMISKSSRKSGYREGYDSGYGAGYDAGKEETSETPDEGEDEEGSE